MIKKVSLLRVVGVCSIIFVFLKIYQHNLTIKVTYDHQRIERKKKLLEKEFNELYVQLIHGNNPDELVAFAEEKLSMKPLKASQVCVLEDTSMIDFLGTTSREIVLLPTGPCDDNVIKMQGGGHVGA